MPRTLAGDPVALRGAAARLRGARRTAEDAARQVQDALERTAGSWTGRAAEAFAVAAVATAARLRAVAVLADAAGPLEIYATELEAAQAQWNAHFAAAADGYGTSGYEPATRALAGAQERARAANERAAAEIERIGSAAHDALAVEQSPRTMTSFAVGTGLGAVGAHQNLLREAAAEAADDAARPGPTIRAIPAGSVVTVEVTPTARTRAAQVRFPTVAIHTDDGTTHRFECARARAVADDLVGLYGARRTPG